MSKQHIMHFLIDIDLLSYVNLGYVPTEVISLLSNLSMCGVKIQIDA